MFIIIIIIIIIIIVITNVGIMSLELFYRSHLNDTKK